ncbi:UBP-type zinc finger domain-containing protein [Streptomyces sp. NPDC057555]|uniref:UBP-type zinc finger domain-containing protein n=1 Tax=Streptomyces sp. NPDC057555 TaxID=3346166 RepID=UPI0036CD6610
MNACTHLSGLPGAGPAPASETCLECLAVGSHPVQLRLCLVCGHVGCCDSSPYRHATGHYEETGHAVMRSLEPGASWRWCYVDQVLV